MLYILYDKGQKITHRQCNYYTIFRPIGNLEKSQYENPVYNENGSNQCDNLYEKLD